jgi:rhamnosyltransferase
VIVAVVTAFRPDHSLLENVAAIRAQVDRVVIVDDGSGPVADTVLNTLVAQGDEVIRTESNSGIAHALNRGVDFARAVGASAVITLDQDSAVPDGYVDQLVGAQRRFQTSQASVGFVVPEYFASVRQGVPQADGAPMRADHRAIQSGMLIPLDTLTAVGGFREDLFIDLVDLEFILRCEARGYVGAAADGLRLDHSLGARYENRLFGVRLRLPLLPTELTLSSPFRYYYRARNRLVVNRIYARRFRARLSRDTLIDLLHFVNAVLVARPRRSLASVLWRAVRDARSGRLGRAPDDILDFASRIRWGVPKTGASE